MRKSRVRLLVAAPFSSREAQFCRWAFCVLAYTLGLMERMHITVVSARVVDGEVRATVRATAPGVRISVCLTFPVTGPTEPWSAARDYALRYLDIQ